MIGRLHFPRWLPALLVVTAIVCLTLATMQAADDLEHAVKERERQSAAHAEAAKQSVQSALKRIDYAMAEQIVKNQAIQRFFADDASSGAASKYIEYRAATEIERMIQSNGNIHSIYFYREADRTVLTSGFIAPLKDFPDRQFLEAGEHLDASGRWSSARKFSQYPLVDPAEDVITLAKDVGPFLNHEGRVVINVRVSALVSSIKTMVSRDGQYIRIIEPENRVLYASDAGSAAGDKIEIARKSIDEADWTIVTGVTEDWIVRRSEAFSIAKIAIAAASVIFLPLYLGVLLRKHYAALKEVSTRLSAYMEEQVHDLSVLKKQYFMELLEEERTIPMERWIARVARLGISVQCKYKTVAVVELDRYGKLVRDDREALLHAKSRLSSAIQKWAAANRIEVWPEWTSQDRLAIFVQTSADPAKFADDLLRGLDRLRGWIRETFGFTVTIGLGRCVDRFSDVYLPYRDAVTALQFKLTFGRDRLILFEQIGEKEAGDHSAFYRYVEETITLFKLASEAWEQSLTEAFQCLQNSMLDTDQIRELLGFMLHRLGRELEEMPPQVEHAWSGGLHAEVTQGMKEADAVGDLRQLFAESFRKLFQEYVSVRNSRTQRTIIHDIRKYIEEQYADPDLSLTQISEKFQINGKYASQLFKEEFGMKFVDFVIGLRIEQAKKMLLDTGKPISQIAQEVGYIHTISFGRTFKKLLGMSPGDYRKQMSV